MNQHKVEAKNFKVKIVKFQDGKGDGIRSREGISVTHYPEHFKEEVVAFAKATSQKEAKDRLSTDFLTFKIFTLVS